MVWILWLRIWEHKVKSIGEGLKTGHRGIWKKRQGDRSGSHGLWELTWEIGGIKIEFYRLLFQVRCVFIVVKDCCTTVLFLGMFRSSWLLHTDLKTWSLCIIQFLWESAFWILNLWLKCKVLECYLFIVWDCCICPYFDRIPNLRHF